MKNRIFVPGNRKQKQTICKQIQTEYNKFYEYKVYTCPYCVQLAREKRQSNKALNRTDA